MDTSDLANKAQSYKGLEIGHPYFYVTGQFTVEVTEWIGNKFDRRRKDTGNYFTDKKRAQQFAERTAKFFMEQNT